MGSIFGGSKQSSSSNSYNQAYGDIKNTFSPLTGQAATGANALTRLLSGDSSGFDAYKRATGFDATAEQGSRGITGNAAASGMLRSGSTGKGLQAFGDTLQNSYANNYLSQLFNQANLGLGAGQLIAGAGQVGQSNSSGSSKPGIGGFLGGIGSGIAASDRRLKKDIFKIGELENGLGIYQFLYKDNSERRIGVMADEVEKIMPEALGPVIDGYQTVNYDKIGG